MTTYFFSVFQPLIFPFSLCFSASDWPNRRMLSSYLSRELIILFSWKVLQLRLASKIHMGK